MPIQSKDIDATSGSAFTFTLNGQDYIVESGVTVESEAGRGVDSHGFSGVNVENSGLISAFAEAIYFSGAQSQLTNDVNARIYGAYGCYAKSSDDVFDNEGTITGRTDGIFDSGGKASVNNDGDISARTIGVALSGDGNSVYNTGNIFATASGSGIGLELSLTKGQSAVVKNLGTIRGPGASVGSTGAGAVSLVNQGTLDGKLSLTNSGGDSVVNRGEIDGNVVLGNGTNTFDGRGGSVDGSIQGGSGVDTIYASKHGDTIFGGAGHDMLHAGDGHDVFGFESYASTASDTIFGFDVSKDVIELDHSAFSKLTPGAVPAFTVGTAASSATDYLFYNSTSGQLFYDPDGSGAGKADLVANLGGGLKMTAHDIKVV